MDKHVDIVGWLHIILGAFGLLVAGFVFIAIVGGGLLSGDSEAIFITSTVGTLVGLFLAVLAIPEIVGGIGLLRRAEWGRVVTLIVAFFELFNFPFGTAIGVYAFWVLLQDETKRIFSYGTA